MLRNGVLSRHFSNVNEFSALYSGCIARFHTFPKSFTAGLYIDEQDIQLLLRHFYFTKASSVFTC